MRKGPIPHPPPTPPPLPSDARDREKSPGKPPPLPHSPPPLPSQMGKLPMAELVLYARRGSRAAFSELMRRYRAPIYALALHLTGNTHDADDVAQDTFVRAYRKLGEFQGASDFYTWLYRIALNLSLNVQRARGRRRTMDLDDPRVALALRVDAAGDPRRAAELREVYARLVAALDALPGPLRSTVVLVALQGMSHEQAGAVLGCSAGTVAWRMHAARRELGAALAPPSGTEESGLLSVFAPAYPSLI